MGNTSQSSLVEGSDSWNAVSVICEGVSLVSR
jgi:hypothetical protein